MASVRKRRWTHNGAEKESWVVTYTDQGGKRRLKTFEKKKDADRFRTDVEASVAQGLHTADRGTVTVARACELWLEDLERRKLATGSPVESTLRNYRSTAKLHLIPRFGAVKMNSIDPDAVQDWLVELRVRKAYGGVERCRCALVEIIKFCIRKRLLNRNVLAEHKVRTPGQQSTIAIPPIDDVRRLLETSGVRWKHEELTTAIRRGVFVRLALFTGMRAGEIAGLAWEAIDWIEGSIDVRRSYSTVNGLKAPKTEAGIRWVPMVPPLRSALLHLHEHLGRPADGPIFVSRSGKLFGGSMIHLTYWQPALRRAGIIEKGGKPPYHLHALRHVAASLLLAGGVDVVALSKMIGHKKPSTTLDVYSHLLPHDQRLKVAMGAVAAALEATPPRQALLTD